MKWIGRRKSTSVDDRRGSGMKSVGGRTLAGGGIVTVIAVVIALLTGNLGSLTDLVGLQPSDVIEQPYIESEEDRQLFDYASVVLADIEDTWNTILPMYGEEYDEPTLTIYDGMVQSGCGTADSGVGPFYCTIDRAIYLDLSFYDSLVRSYGASRGDFVMSYVIAHEAGHHVQTLLGVTSQMNSLRQRVAAGQMSQADFNDYSVRYELQADYLAGVVAHFMKERGYLEQGDIAEALSAASAVGDDSIQRRAQGYVDPDTFNHGTSDQRQAWFMKGFEAGDLSDWDTFDTAI
ncbi:MAG: zinc metallopeptidase [Clostridiales bacterium]|jgi:predicted metalloprotease|nr:zinc metallopeptidase [Clostridiales bacterium]